MKLQDHLHITLTQACHENWDAMSPVEQGRHCAVCDKVVVDFASMTDEEVLQYFHQKATVSCARVKSTQLFQQHQPSIKFNIKQFVFASVLLFLAQLPMKLQAKVVKLFGKTKKHESRKPIEMPQLSIAKIKGVGPSLNDSTKLAVSDIDLNDTTTTFTTFLGGCRMESYQEKPGFRNEALFQYEALRTIDQFLQKSMNK